jgi:hypothetical protein
MPPTPSQQKQPGTLKAGDYRYMSNTRAMELPIGTGLYWLEPGEIVTLSTEDLGSPKAQRLLEEGQLVDISTIVADPEASPLTVEGEAVTMEAKGGK